MRAIILLSTFIILSYNSGAQEGYQPAPENFERREWFQDAKFGLFVHWGVYSIMAGGGDQGIAEWIMDRKKSLSNNMKNFQHFFIHHSLIRQNGLQWSKRLV